VKEEKAEGKGERKAPRGCSGNHGRRGESGRKTSLYIKPRSAFSRLSSFSPLYATLVTAHCERWLGYSSSGSNIPTSKENILRRFVIFLSSVPKISRFLSRHAAADLSIRVFYYLGMLRVRQHHARPISRIRNKSADVKGEQIHETCESEHETSSLQFSFLPRCHAREKAKRVPSIHFACFLSVLLMSKFPEKRSLVAGFSSGINHNASIASDRHLPR